MKTFTETISVDGVEITIAIEHNLGSQFGLSIEDAFDNWLVRTDDYTSESFCNYLKGKDSANICKALAPMVK